MRNKYLDWLANNLIDLEKKESSKDKNYINEEWEK